MKRLVLKQWVKEVLAFMLMGIIAFSTIFYMSYCVEKIENTTNSRIEGVEIDK